MSRSYGSKLPTSLTYIVLGTRGCSPWRPAADMGTARCKNHDCSPRFSRAGKSASDTAGSAVLYRNIAPISGRTDSRGCVLNKEEKTLPEAPTGVSRFVCVTALAPARGRFLHPGSGILTRFPFDQKPVASKNIPAFLTELSCLLGPTDPCSTAVHMEPFSTSVFKVLF